MLKKLGRLTSRGLKICQEYGKLINTEYNHIFSAQRAKGRQNSIQGMRHHFFHVKEQPNRKVVQDHSNTNSVDVNTSSSIKSVQQNFVKQ